MEIGEFVREQRKLHGLTQKQLADKAGVGLNFVYQLEKNKPSVQLDCTRQVLQALGLDLTVSDRSTIPNPLRKLAEAPRPPSPWD